MAADRLNFVAYYQSRFLRVGDSRYAERIQYEFQIKSRLNRRILLVMSEEPEPTIHLDQFLKRCGVATGGQAKLLIQGGEVIVNGEVETRRRRQLRAGDEVVFMDEAFVVARMN